MVEKDTTLQDYTKPDSTPKRKEFEHEGHTIIVEYVKPTVSQVARARKKSTKMESRGRKVSYEMDMYEFEVSLFMVSCKGTNIPGIPEQELAIRNLNDEGLWGKLMEACEIRETPNDTGESLDEAIENVLNVPNLHDVPEVQHLDRVYNGVTEDEEVKN